MLAAGVFAEGGKAELCGIVRDNRTTLRNRIRRALDSDILIVTGGVSVGKYDYVKSVLEEVGVLIKFWRVNIKPGMPLVFGTRRRTLVFGLPGNPVSTGVTFLQFVRPALRKMLGREDLGPMRYTAVLSSSFAKSDGKRHYLRGIARRQNGTLRVTTTGTQSSGAISSLSRANCLIIIPEDVRRKRRGDPVEVEFI
jgi:molybdopterin molybdotransferase